MKTTIPQLTSWFIYLLICSDQSIYIGITNNLEKRLKAHNGLIKGGSKYTRTRQPVSLLRFFEVATKSEALKIEYKIKQLSRIEKLELIDIKELKGNE